MNIDRNCMTRRCLLSALNELNNEPKTNKQIPRFESN